MSAILSIFNRNNEPVDPRAVEMLLAARPERGVDGADAWIADHVALAHQHFWITPQEWGEKQPLIDPAGRWVITADARLDNRDELLIWLDVNNVDPEQLSDAALILLAYQSWGTACVEKFLGDFAFAIWDADEAHLFIGRDALGARGLCYSINGDRCLVASEVAQLLAHPAVDPQVNDRRVAAYLTRLYGDQEESFYEDIHYCPPAHCMLVTSDSVRKWRYWDIDPGARIRYKDDQEYAEHFLMLLTEAVRSRLRTVGPVGISMSGGLDSTTLAAITTELLPETNLPQERLKSFSYVFDELTSCDERQYIQPVAERYRLDTTFIPCDDKWTLRDVRKWPVLSGFVFHDAYAWLPDAVMTAAGEEGCRVLLAGYYGDILFTGAVNWAVGMMNDLRLRELSTMITANSVPIDWRRDLVVNGLRHLVPQSVRRGYSRYRDYDILTKYPGLHPRLVELAQSRIQRDAEQERRLKFNGEQWQRLMALNLNVFVQGFSSTRFQYNGHGVELAMPYWDRRLVEFIMAVPADQLGYPGRDRNLLRNAAVGLLPGSVTKRRWKTSFSPLKLKGLLDKEVDTVNQVMDRPLAVKKQYVNGIWLTQQLENGRGWSSEENQHFLWKCLSLELWLKQRVSIPSQ